MAEPMPVCRISTGLAALMNCPVCPVADGTGPKMRPGPAEAGVACMPGPAVPHFRSIGPRVSLGLAAAGPGFMLRSIQVVNSCSRDHVILVITSSRLANGTHFNADRQFRQT